MTNSKTLLCYAVAQRAAGLQCAPLFVVKSQFERNVGKGIVHHCMNTEAPALQAKNLRMLFVTNVRATIFESGRHSEGEGGRVFRNIDILIGDRGDASQTVFFNSGL